MRYPILIHGINYCVDFPILSCSCFLSKALKAARVNLESQEKKNRHSENLTAVVGLFFSKDSRWVKVSLFDQE